jgi:broad specificity phosphatase PhoE
MKQTWYLFRHALSTYSKTGYGEKVLTAEILPNETAPIQEMSVYLKTVNPSVNYSSEILRCRQTAQIITDNTQKIFIPDGRINEYHQIEFNDFATKIKDIVHEIEKLKTPNILICTHGAVVGAIKHLLLKGNFQEKDLADYPKCGELLIIKDKIPKLINFN